MDLSPYLSAIILVLTVESSAAIFSTCQNPPSQNTAVPMELHSKDNALVLPRVSSTSVLSLCDGDPPFPLALVVTRPSVSYSTKGSKHPLHPLAHCTSVMHTQVLPGYLCIVQYNTGVATRGAACSEYPEYLTCLLRDVCDGSWLSNPDNGDRHQGCGHGPSSVSYGRYCIVLFNTMLTGTPFLSLVRPDISFGPTRVSQQRQISRFPE